jgi:hypothetical protein
METRLCDSFTSPVVVLKWTVLVMFNAIRRNKIKYDFTLRPFYNANYI